MANNKKPRKERFTNTLAKALAKNKAGGR